MRSLFVLALMLAACATGRTSAAPDLIAIREADLMPEGLAVLPDGDFVVSSATRGQLGRVALSGVWSPFADDPALVSTLGTHVDPAGRLLATAVADIGVSKRSRPETFAAVARVAFFDVPSGRLVRVVELASLLPGARHFANDLTWDDAGHVYVTDSFAGVIYRIDRDFSATVFATSPSFALTVERSFGLNGIVFEPKERALLVAKLDEGKLFKVPLARPGDVSEVSLPKAVRADGLLLLDDGSLVASGSINSPADTTSPGLVSRLRSTDGWRSASIVDEQPSGAPSVTTVAERSGELFVNHALYFAERPVTVYPLKKVRFAR